MPEIWVKSPDVNQNSKRYDSAFADEVLAEIARQRGLTRTEVQERAGITSSTWGNYFRERTTRIPLGVIFAVSEALGVLPEEMMRRARLRADELEGQNPTLDPRLAGMMSPETRAHMEEQVERSRAERGGDVPQDPPGGTTKGRRSA
jgi:transcriptional regulator with XRE-family HTH domain